MFKFGEEKKEGRNAMLAREFKEISNKVLRDCAKTLTGDDEDTDIIDAVASIDERYVPLIVGYFKLINKSYELLEAQAAALDAVERIETKVEQLDTKLDGLESYCKKK